MESNGVLDSALHVLDSGFQTLVRSGFLKLYFGFQSPRFQIFQNPEHGVKGFTKVRASLN